MKLKVTREFRAVRPGDVYPSAVLAGEIVEGRLADIALSQKCGEIVGMAPSADVITAEELAALVGENERLNGVIVEQQAQIASLQAEIEKLKASANQPPPVEAPAAQAVEPPAEETTKPPATPPPAKIVVRARLIDRWEGADDKGKPVKYAKGAVISGALAQKLVDEKLATVVEMKDAPAA